MQPVAVCSAQPRPAGDYRRVESNEQNWHPALYDQHARFVSDLGMPVVALLAPRPGERILDLGCGDGALILLCYKV
jgi:hypothetical protein